MKHFKAFAFVLLVPLALALTVISGPVAAQDLRNQIAASSVLEEIKKKGVLRVGMASFVPWAMFDKKGELIGFEIDVAKKLAKDSKWKVEFVPTSFAGIIPALLAGKFDTIITGMAIAPKRNLTVNFTIPYYWGARNIAANKKLAGDWDSMDDINQDGVILSHRRGGQTTDMIKELWPKVKQVLFDDDAQALQEVLNGGAHAIMTSEPKPTMWVLANPDKLFLPLGKGARIFPVPAGFAVRKGDPDILNYYNNWIIQHEENGWLKERADFWFSSTGWFGDVDNNPFARRK